MLPFLPFNQGTNVPNNQQAMMFNPNLPNPNNFNGVNPYFQPMNNLHHHQQQQQQQLMALQLQGQINLLNQLQTQGFLMGQNPNPIPMMGLQNQLLQGNPMMGFATGGGGLRMAARAVVPNAPPGVPTAAHRPKVYHGEVKSNNSSPASQHYANGNSNRKFSAFGKGQSSNNRFQKSQAHDMGNPKGNMKPFNKNCERGQHNQRGGKLVSANFEEATTNRPRYVINYPENEIQQWREARKKNFPTRDNIIKKLTSGGKSGEYADGDDKLRRQQLKEVLAKQAELGVEVAEIPSSYFCEPGEQVHGNEIELWRQARKKNFPNRANMKELAKDMKSNEDASGNNKLRCQASVAVAEIPPSYRPYEQVPEMNNNVGDLGDGKAHKRKLMDINGPSPCKSNSKRGWPKGRKAKNNAAIVKREPSLLQKLLTADIKRDKSRLLQVFRFMVLNDFFKNGPDMPLKFPVITAKDEAGFGAEASGRKNQSPNGVEAEAELELEPELAAVVGVAKNKAAGEISSQKEPDVAYEVMFGFGTDDNAIADEETVHLVENEGGKREQNEMSEEGEIID